MAVSSEFTVDDVTFQFEIVTGGMQTISVGQEVCSQKRSMFGCKHEFEYQGDSYAVKAKPGIANFTFKIQKNGREITVLPKGAKPIPPLVLVACGWPMIMVFIGGAIGGGLGGLAFGLNVGIYKSKLPGFLKPLLILLTGAAAVGLWLLIVSALFE